MKTVKAERLLRAVQAPAPAVVSKRCPSGAGLIGPKLDLPPGGDAFETAPLLAPCVYKGMLDSESSQYYKFSLQAGQTLKIVMRSRDMSGYAAVLSLSLHGPNGGVISGYSTSSESTVTEPLEYKADESGAVYVSVHGALRESAFEGKAAFSICGPSYIIGSRMNELLFREDNVGSCMQGHYDR